MSAIQDPGHTGPSLPDIVGSGLIEERSGVSRNTTAGTDQYGAVAQRPGRLAGRDDAGARFPEGRMRLLFGSRLDAPVTALRVPPAEAGTSPCLSIGSRSGSAKGRAGEEEAQP